MPSLSHNLQMPTKPPPGGGERKRGWRRSCLHKTIEIMSLESVPVQSLLSFHSEDKPFPQHLLDSQRKLCRDALSHLTLYMQEEKVLTRFSQNKDLFKANLDLGRGGWMVLHKIQHQHRESRTPESCR